ncbi:hypothetical protein MHTCC0001_35310 [Flavobacteriaceae bacterium MHTCC 0001]
MKKTSSEAILEKELETFDWDSVDLYPSFSECDHIDLKHEKRVCFESTLHNQISMFLQQELIIVSQDINDTLLLELQVSNQGELQLLGLEMDSLTKAEIPNLKQLIISSLDSLPKISAAIKRSQPVTTKFEMPLIIEVY